MVKPIKPVITILENDEYQLLLIGGMLLVFLIIILFFSKYYYNKQYNVSKVVDSQGKENPLITEGGLNKCNKGQCVVEISTGLKKCPADINTILFYDINTQTCADSNNCPPEVPYAVNSDGSVNEQSNCTTDKCNCSAEITCPVYNSSKFSIINGSIFSSYASDKNFIFDQVPLSLENNYQGKIKIDQTREYCKLNSTYTSTLVGGCSFTNQINDFLMDCTKQDISQQISVSPYSLDPYYLSTSTIGSETNQFCEVQPYLDSNWNNMTLCINQNPCKLGNFTYNYDKKRPPISKDVDKNIEADLAQNDKQINSRDFCQSYSSNLNTYLTDLQYYTLSCIGGTSCNELPDQEDIEKFYSARNQELDISALNASYEVKYVNNFFIATNDINYTSNPFINNIRSGDMIKIKTNFFILRVITENSNDKLEAYLLEKDGTYTKYDLKETDDIEYFPQYALNGFSYNTNFYEYIYNSMILTYKVSNLINIGSANGSISGQNRYIPSYSITQFHTFFRSGLAQPVGYVFKQEVSEEQVEEDISQQSTLSGFNASNYKLKQTPFDTSYYNNISMYSPVWNNNYGRSECIRCNPLLVASINMKQLSSSGNENGFAYDALTIQFSGKDFGHYRKNFQINNGDENFDQSMWCYESRSKINLVETSTPKVIYLDRPNTNLKIGDYILSTKSEFNFTIKQIGNKDYPELVGKSCLIFIGEYYETSGSIKMYTPFFDNNGTDGFYGLGMDNNTYQEFEYGAFIKSVYQADKTFRISSLPNNKIQDKGFLFGNKYTAVFTTLNINDDSSPEKITGLSTFPSINVSIIPSVQIVDIIDDSKILTSYGDPSTRKITKTSSINNLNNNLFNKTSLDKTTLVQFISLDRNLFLNNDSSEINGDSNKGTGGKIVIQEITDGRISSVSVQNSGNGYTNLSPLVRLKSYDHYLF